MGGGKRGGGKEGIQNWFIQTADYLKVKSEILAGTVVGLLIPLSIQSYMNTCMPLFINAYIDQCTNALIHSFIHSSFTCFLIN